MSDVQWNSPAIDMVDLHRRVERLLRPNGEASSPQPSLSPRSSLSSVSPPVSPLYDPALKQNKLSFPYEPVLGDDKHIYDNLPLRTGYCGSDPLYENIGKDCIYLLLAENATFSHFFIPGIFLKNFHVIFLFFYHSFCKHFSRYFFHKILHIFEFFEN